MATAVFVFFAAALLAVFLFSGIGLWVEERLKGGMAVIIFGVAGSAFAAARLQDGTPLGVDDAWGALFVLVLFLYHFGRSRQWDLSVERRVPGGWDALLCVVMLAMIAVARVVSPKPWRLFQDTASVVVIVALAGYSLWSWRRKKRTQSEG